GHGCRAARLEDARDVAFHRGEHQVDLARVEALAVRDGEVEDRLGRLLPAEPAAGPAAVADGVAVRFARRAARGGHRRDLEPRVVRERDERLLAGDAGGADHRDAPLAHGPASIGGALRGVNPRARPRARPAPARKRRGRRSGRRARPSARSRGAREPAPGLRPTRAPPPAPPRPTAAPCACSRTPAPEGGFAAVAGAWPSARRAATSDPRW